MYKTETHLHTKDSSGCGWLTAKEMIELYHEIDYTTVFVSDHISEIYLNKNEDELSWEERVDKCFLGYYEAKKVAKEYGMYVLNSPEFAFVDSPNHYLCYGLTAEYIKEREEIFAKPHVSILKTLVNYGMYIIQAHPYREQCYPDAKNVMAFEVRNTNPRHFVESDEPRAIEIAQKYNLPITAGSDAHRIEDVGLTGIFSQKKITTIEDYIEQLKNGKTMML